MKTIYICWILTIAVVVSLVCFIVYTSVNRMYCPKGIVSQNPKIFNDIHLKDLVTIGIKTFYRPHCLSNALYHIRKRYPNIRIIVADDSSIDVKKMNQSIVQRYTNCSYLSLNHDSGISFGRNEIVKETKTPFVFLQDDDCYFTNTVDINAMVNFLQSSKIQLIAGICVKGHAPYDKHFKRVEKKDNLYIVHYNCHKKTIPNKFLKNTFETNITLNFFLATRSSLLKSPWDNKLKIGEHEKFFVEFFLNGFRCATSESISFKELQGKHKKYLQKAKEYRNRAKKGGTFEISKSVVFINS